MKMSGLICYLLLSIFFKAKSTSNSIVRLNYYTNDHILTMKIRQLKLYTDTLEAEKEFYTERLGLELKESTPESVTLNAGWSELTFRKSDKPHRYHYCFLIPSNKLMESLEWMEKRVEVIEIEEGRKTQNFESWNADSFYFYDGSGNIAEFIVRYDLENGSSAPFDAASLLGVNEIGLPVEDVERANRQLEEELGTSFWKGDARFGTNGSQEGLFLLPNYHQKTTWFPVSMPIRPEPFKAVVENGGETYSVVFKGEEIEVESGE